MPILKIVLPCSEKYSITLNIAAIILICYMYGRVGFCVLSSCELYYLIEWVDKNTIVLEL